MRGVLGAADQVFHDRIEINFIRKARIQIYANTTGFLQAVGNYFRSLGFQI
jgi:hypothetical protein